MEEFPVKVYIYDLSKGLARSLSMPLLGKQLDGIWHTGIVAYGQEFYYGGMGIESCQPCGTVLGQPDSIVDLGVTQVPFDMMMEYLSELSNTSFKPECYHLLEHNCNTFSNEIANFLTGNNIPAFVTNLPQEVLSTPFGSMIRPFIDSMSVSPSGGHSVFPRNEAANNSASKPKNETSTKAKDTTAATPSQASEQVKFTPIKYNDKQVLQRLDRVKSELKGNFSNEDMKLIEETTEYVSVPENKRSFSIGPDHLQALTKVIVNPEHNDEERCALAGLLQLVMLNQDMIGLISHDHRRTIMSLLNDLSPIEVSNSLRIIITKMLVNVSSEKEGLKWLMSEESWLKDKDTLSNLSTTMSTCLASLLSDNADVRNTAVSLAANFSQYKNLNEECSIELGSALIECLHKSEERISQERCLVALCHCVKISPEVAALVKVMAVDLDTYEKVSETAKSYCQTIRQASKSLPI